VAGDLRSARGGAERRRALDDLLANPPGSTLVSLPAPPDDMVGQGCGYGVRTPFHPPIAATTVAGRSLVPPAAHRSGGPVPTLGSLMAPTPARNVIRPRLTPVVGRGDDGPS